MIRLAICTVLEDLKCVHTRPCFTFIPPNEKFLASSIQRSVCRHINCTVHVEPGFMLQSSLHPTPTPFSYKINGTIKGGLIMLAGWVNVISMHCSVFCAYVLIEALTSHINEKYHSDKTVFATVQGWMDGHKSEGLK